MVYSIVPDEETKTANPYYKIDANTGLITTTNVTTDYEERNPTKQTEMKNIRVRATSSEGHFSYVTNIIVNLVDINDNAPQFDSLTLRTPIQVSENTTRDAREYVTTLRAHDQQPRQPKVEQLHFPVVAQDDVAGFDIQM